MTDAKWYKPEDPTPREQCPCCDYLSLPERGNFLICRICFWEDDGQDLEEIDQESGPNHGLTLRQGRENFRVLGACDSKMLKHVLPDHMRQSFMRKLREDPR